MMRSMTGYAQARGEQQGWGLNVTLKALNHRFLDLRMRLPSELEAREPHFRALVRTVVRRGHLDVEFQLEATGKPTLRVDREFLRYLLGLYAELQQEFQIRGEPDLATLLRLPGVLRAGERASESTEFELLGQLAETLLNQALQELNQMRRTEGVALEREMRARLEEIGRRQRQLVGLNQQARPAQHERLQERLRELLGEAEINPTRLAEEAAYLAERSDISEELTRLASHAEQFELLLAEEGEIGKRLDFLLQEMNRETNTLLSKAPGLDEAGLEMTRVGLEIKADVERLREQVQNVE